MRSTRGIQRLSDGQAAAGTWRVVRVRLASAVACVAVATFVCERPVRSVNGPRLLRAGWAQADGPPCRLPIRLLPAARLSPAIERAVRHEVDAIWRPHGVVPDWLGADPDDRLRPQAVVVSLVSHPPGAASPGVLGLVRFGAPARPLNLVHIGLPFDRVLSQGRFGGRALADWPLTLQERVLGRAVGRVLSHEIGHYVLATRQHTPTGLMRAELTIPELVHQSRAPFALDPIGQALLSPAWSAPACAPASQPAPSPTEQ